MKLVSFRVRNFRSVDDSGVIQVSNITALLGRNESGKSNLLVALASLNPPDGLKKLTPIKDYPRNRKLENCDESTHVIDTEWHLSDTDKKEFISIFPRAKNVEKVTVSRCYGTTLRVGINPIEKINFELSNIKKIIRKLSPLIEVEIDKLEDSVKTKYKSSLDSLSKKIVSISIPKRWAIEAKNICKEMRLLMAESAMEISDKADDLLAEIEELADSIESDDDKHAKARTWIREKLPKFIYVDEYPEIHGHQDIKEYLERKSNPRSADKNFAKLCKVSGLKPEQLQNLLGSKDSETRNQLVNRASAVITKEIKRLWKDRELKIRFNIDSQYLDTFISDPTTTYDVEVNLDERSRGFKWFFSFYVIFSADTQDGYADNAILLLDEPGLYLHASSQSDLVKHLSEDYDNQIIYTTHSPFMVPVKNLDAVRTVNIDQENGTTVTNDPTGDSRTLFPIQSAIGYSISQSLFVGQNNVVVEGVTDYWILSSISEYLINSGKKGLDHDLILTPAGGAQKIPYMVALLASENLNVIVILDEERAARITSDNVIKNKLIRKKNLIFVSEAWTSNPPTEADIEDLIEKDVYRLLVEESYSKELRGKRYELNDNIPRNAKRFEEAFKSVGIEFNKTRPARLMLRKMAEEPSKIVTPKSETLFINLFELVNERIENLKTTSRKPFS